jgi:hypothetical protein
MLMIDELEIAGPSTGAHSSNGRSRFRRILVPVRSPGESGSALAVAARICTLASGVLCLVHVRTCDPPLRSAARFYRETPAQAAAVLEETLLVAWACGAGPPRPSWMPGAGMWPWRSHGRRPRGPPT